MRTSFTVLLFILCSKVLLAQNKDSLFIDQLQDKLFERALKTEENFHIITDRPWYFPGEEIWFKVYITTNGLPVTGSGVLYVSLTDTSGQILIKKILPVEDDGASYGNLKIPAGLTKGWYSLGVQTEWGRNFNDGTEKII